MKHNDVCIYIYLSHRENPGNTKHVRDGHWKAILIPFLDIFGGQTALAFFLVVTALIVWSHLCESCYGSLRSFFNKM